MAINIFKNIDFLRIVRYFFMAAGIFFTIAVILAFTSLPFWGIYWLGTSKSEPVKKPATIVLLGGGGMPSESNLIRSWYLEKVALHFPEAGIVIAMPGDPSDTLSTPHRMKAELEQRGINRGRISFESKGTNTRSQALYCRNQLNPAEALLLVTSPEHARRAVLSFQKAGFKNVNALPAFENAAEADFSFNDKDLGGRKTLAPEVGDNLSVRYQVWNHLKYEITFARELTALLYYKLRGWI